MADTLNKVLYVDSDFATAVAAISNYLNTEYPDEFNDYVAANMGQALIDIIAYAEQNLLWYLNRKITDLYFPTAVTPNSVAKIARMLGYKPKAATYAETVISMRLKKGPYTFPVPINKGQKFRGPNRTIWEYRGESPVVYAPGETVKSFTIGQGETLVSNFVSSGATSQFFELRSVATGKFVAGSDFEVRVAGVLWEEYPIIPFDTIPAYETNLLSTPPVVRFGDGVQGNVPAQGLAIEVRCVATDGFKGRILSGSIKEPVGSIVANFQAIPVEITQANASVGGDDPEDIRSIVVNAPQFQRTQDRAITKGDYDFLANQYPNVARADAKIIRGIGEDVTVQAVYFQFNQLLQSLQTVSGTVSGGDPVTTVVGQVSGYMDILYDHIDSNFTDSCNGNLVQVAVLAKDANRLFVPPLQSTLDGLKAYLDERKDVTHTVAVVEGTSKVINAVLKIQVKVSPNAVEDDVVQAILDTFAKSDETPFGLLVERDFNASLYLWQCYQAVQENVADAEERIAVINIEIEGPEEYLDSKGNLIAPDGFVIQNGGVTIDRLPRY